MKPYALIAVLLLAAAGVAGAADSKDPLEQLADEFVAAQATAKPPQTRPMTAAERQQNEANVNAAIEYLQHQELLDAIKQQQH